MWPPLESGQLMECGRSDFWGCHRRWYNIHLVLMEWSLLEPSHHTVHKPRPHGEAMCWCSVGIPSWGSPTASFSPRLEWEPLRHSSPGSHPTATAQESQRESPLAEPRTLEDDNETIPKPLSLRVICEAAPLAGRRAAQPLLGGTSTASLLGGLRLSPMQGTPRLIPWDQSCANEHLTVPNLSGLLTHMFFFSH